MILKLLQYDDVSDVMLAKRMRVWLQATWDAGAREGSKPSGKPTEGMELSHEADWHGRLH